MWDKTLGGSGAEAFGDLQILRDGFRVGASSLSGNDGNKTRSSRGGWDVWLVELDSEGNIRKQDVFGASGDDMLLSFVPTRNGYALLARSTSQADGVHKTAPAQSPGGAPLTEWLLLLDTNLAILADESYEMIWWSLHATLVPMRDDSLLWAAGSTVRKLNLRYEPTLDFDTPNQNIFIARPATLKLRHEQKIPGATFQWSLNGVDIPDATNQTHFIAQVLPEDAGAYQLTVRTPFGSAKSTNMTLAVVYAETRVELMPSQMEFMPSLMIQGAFGMRYRVEASTALQPTVWSIVGSLTLTNNPQGWLDLNAPSTTRFYRVRPE